jgi:DNA polymerase-4
VAEKSMGHERTLPRDISDTTEISSVLLYLASMVARRLREKGVMGRTITVKVRFSDFVTITRSETLLYPTDSEHQICKTAFQLAAGAQSSLRRVRLLGVSVSHLTQSGQSCQMLLPFAEYADNRGEVYCTIDRIRDRFGEGSIGWAGAGYCL